jgi:hypothetical protein
LRRAISSISARAVAAVRYQNKEQNQRHLRGKSGAQRASDNTVSRLPIPP